LIARQNGYQDMEDRANVLLKKAEAYIEACYDEERKVYQNAIDSRNLDASTLQLIVMDYLDPKSERALHHLEMLEKELKGENGLFYRYKHQDDFGRPKSTFLVCAFWYVEALACVGRVEEAKEILERLLTYSNHLGLFSEDVTEDNGSQWGNFPQAYSHVGLMNAVYRLAIKLDKPIFQ
jgi:GH15 family glucan-1,4-alpha-glucosidase